MKIGIVELRDRKQTGKEIYECAKFYDDLGEIGLLDLTLNQIFDYVRKLPYVEDYPEIELVSRPKYILDKKQFPALDCKKKAVIIGAWLEAHGIPWRLVAISERDDEIIHHVFPQAFIENEWLCIDATYPEYFLFQPKTAATAAEELPR